MQYPFETGWWVYQENSGLWGMGAWKMTKNSLFWLQRICCYIPPLLVFRTKLRVTLTYCSLKPYGKATEAIVRLYRENSGYREKWSQTIGGRADWGSPGFICQRQPPKFGWPSPGRGCLWRSTLASQVGGYIGRTLVYGKWWLEKWQKIRYSGYNAGIHVAGSNFGWPWPSVAWSPMEGLQRL